MTRIEEIKKRLSEITPGPWGPNWSMNYPFYADVRKPAPSFSKHDSERPTYWRIQDAVFVAAAESDIRYLLDLLEKNGVKDGAF